MEYIHSALLLHAAGQDVTEENVSSVLEAAGVDVDSSRVKALVASLEGVDIEEAMNQAVAGGAAPAPAASGGEAAEAADEEEAEAEEDEGPEKEDVSDEEAAEGLGGLF
jgi:large subunit ribosomal protein L12